MFFLPKTHNLNISPYVALISKFEYSYSKATCCALVMSAATNIGISSQFDKPTVRILNVFLETR